MKKSKPKIHEGHPKSRPVAFWLSPAELAKMDAKAKKRTKGNRTKLLRAWIAA